MSQQNPIGSEEQYYKRKLFYDNGIRFVEVKGRQVMDYTPPSPVMKSAINQTIKSSAGFIQLGTSHYTTSLTMLFYSKQDFAEWLQFIGAEHKYYDEKGTIYTGIVASEPDIRSVEQGSKYMVSVNLVLNRKQDFEYRHQTNFNDLDGHWCAQYIQEMEQRGLISLYGYDGQPLQYFFPNKLATRAEMTSFILRTYRYLDKILRGY